MVTHFNVAYGYLRTFHGVGSGWLHLFYNWVIQCVSYIL